MQLVIWDNLEPSTNTRTEQRLSEFFEKYYSDNLTHDEYISSYSKNDSSELIEDSISKLSIQAKRNLKNPSQAVISILDNNMPSIKSTDKILKIRSSEVPDVTVSLYHKLNKVNRNILPKSKSISYTSSTNSEKENENNSHSDIQMYDHFDNIDNLNIFKIQSEFNIRLIERKNSDASIKNRNKDISYVKRQFTLANESNDYESDEILCGRSSKGYSRCGFQTDIQYYLHEPKNLNHHDDVELLQQMREISEEYSSILNLIDVKSDVGSGFENLNQAASVNLNTSLVRENNKYLLQKKNYIQIKHIIPFVRNNRPMFNFINKKTHFSFSKSRRHRFRFWLNKKSLDMDKTIYILSHTKSE